MSVVWPCLGGGIFRRLVCASNILINLFVLGVFKYYNFFADNLELLFNSFGYHLDWATLNIILPVGISFYTFQALSYTIDVYRKQISPTYDIIEFFAYISFFPQLVAGPIERATNLLPQFQQERQFEYAKAVDGLRQMLWGFFKKLVVADNCAFAVNSHWDDYPFIPGFSIIILAILFSFQIYCDFSGYSDIAIGTARLFGFNLMRNFNLPYFSRTIPEFWRRWHISLMTWFRDYIYFPLGGSRCARWKVIRNTIIVFLVSGLWHGANWTFVLWGLYHSCLIAISIMIGLNTKTDQVVAGGKLMPSATECTQMIFTFILATIGWVIFRAENVNQLYGVFEAIITNQFFDARYIYGKVYLIFIFIMILIEWLQRDRQHAFQFPNNRVFRLKAVRWAVYVSTYIFIVAATGQSQTFLYFQF